MRAYLSEHAAPGSSGDDVNVTYFYHDTHYSYDGYDGYMWVNILVPHTFRLIMGGRAVHIEAALSSLRRQTMTVDGATVQLEWWGADPSRRDTCGDGTCARHEAAFYNRHVSGRRLQAAQTGAAGDKSDVTAAAPDAAEQPAAMWQASGEPAMAPLAASAALLGPSPDSTAAWPVQAPLPAPASTAGGQPAEVPAAAMPANRSSAAAPTDPAFMPPLPYYFCEQDCQVRAMHVCVPPALEAFQAFARIAPWRRSWSHYQQHTQGWSYGYKYDHYPDIISRRRYNSKASSALYSRDGLRRYKQHNFLPFGSKQGALIVHPEVAVRFNHLMIGMTNSQKPSPQAACELLLGAIVQHEVCSGVDAVAPAVLCICGLARTSLAYAVLLRRRPVQPAGRHVRVL